MSTRKLKSINIQPMPDFKAMLMVDSSRVLANQVVDAVGDNPEYFGIVLQLCFEEKYPVSMLSLIHI